ncbi:MAG: nucleoside diphosphate pyrophosphatase [Piscirickettsiaceae bacterium CG_4_9_14_3_um_filter_43_564]|nr:NUDIX domain-containing protein [Thiomicrospira sp.]OIP94706.1 MAG: nucleoside diphosphate pyrophosphatase [Thiomicrospira sp. CG2_30_44_34]PIQ03220.1 MAG: nucleoside diphosphate pyrophosphatase [Piscirickettsiaceae bacterium CG18_big_fil_WC_8_21_14_2_50_44_103]PIU39495.1 MAG: nucleoside diphosphate pyrophosphatase [Piscirickettsiaceae bacterium CG07_land_8_20_14_0_80_44_28]PIW58582.1 MAG: nucleoside diphosphate pyrophosphatase [Piscirickettsiaceae bacterium CG12_big_fil_rev_8_21_14_0_65_44_
MQTDSIKQFEISTVEKVYDGFFKMHQITFRHSLYQGGWTSPLIRELFGRGQAVVVLLYDPKAQQVILIEQIRAGTLQHAADQNDQAWLIEPVAGMIEAGESKLSACQRETQEEAGVEVNTFEPICHFYPSPGGSDEVLYLYGAEVDVNQLPDYAGEASEMEDIRIIKMPFQDAKAKLLKAEFNVASTIIGLQWLFYQKLAVSCP